MVKLSQSMMFHMSEKYSVMPLLQISMPSSSTKNMQRPIAMFMKSFIVVSRPVSSTRVSMSYEGSTAPSEVISNMSVTPVPARGPSV